jgi:hypothetical protein
MSKNTKAALAAACDPETTDPEWPLIEKTLLAAGLCPRCARDGFRIRLGVLEPETEETYEGRHCLDCEEFYRTPGHHPDDGPPEDYGGTLGADGQVHSDADPGL